MGNIGDNIVYSKTKGAQALLIPRNIIARSVGRTETVGNIATDMRPAFRDIDYQQHQLRFMWHNLPHEIPVDMIERILYFRSSGMFFYIKELAKFHFLPYRQGEGGIDFYGRYVDVVPYTFSGNADSSNEVEPNQKKSAADIYLGTQLRKNIMQVPMVDTIEDAIRLQNEGAVVLFDKAPGISYINSSRETEAEKYMGEMQQLFVQIKAASVNANGFTTYTAEDGTQAELLQQQVDAINYDRMHGKLAGVITGGMTGASSLKSSSASDVNTIWQSFESMDNFRMRTMGVFQNTGGLKTQYVNDANVQQDIMTDQLMYLNAFRERIRFSVIVNSIWGLQVYPEPILMIQEGARNGDNGQQDTAQEV